MRECYKNLEEDWLESHGSISRKEQDKLWLTAAGGEKKGRAFGVGSDYSRDRRVLNPRAVHPNPPPPPMPRPAVAAAATPPSLQPPILPAVAAAAGRLSPSPRVQQPRPPPPMPPAVSGPSIDEEIAFMEKYEKLQVLREEARRMELELSQPSQGSFQSMMNEAMPPLMASQPAHFPSFPFEDDHTRG